MSGEYELPDSLPALLDLLHSPQANLQETRQLHLRLRKAGALQTLSTALQDASEEEQSTLLESLLHLAELSSQVARLLDQGRPLGCGVEVRDSSVEGGGDGLWVTGTAEAGTVLCLYPGVHAGPDVSSVAHALNPYLIQLRGGGSIDAAPETLQRMQRARNAESVPTTFSAYKANHCCPGSSPNALLHEIFCLDKQPWCDMETSIQGKTQPDTAIVIVTLRQLQDEEVFVDYRWTGECLPEWYHPCNSLV